MSRVSMYVSVPGVGDYERLTVLAPWGGEEFVRYVPISTATEQKNAIASSNGRGSQSHGS